MQPPQPLQNPLEGHSRYKKVAFLNKGTFGFVVLALDLSSNQYVAIKFIERGDKVSLYVEREILNHRCLIHPHVVQFLEVFLTPTHLGIVMEYAPGGDLFQYVVRKGGLKEGEARWFFQQLIVGVDYIHKMGVANRDIKLENTLLDGSPRPLVKICDFGYSKREKFQSEPTTKVGTSAYLAPEVIMVSKGKPYNGKTADIWACGVMLYVMLVGAYPFERPEDKHPIADYPKKIISRILRGDFIFPKHAAISRECQDLLKQILVLEPSKRISIPEIQQHAWYKIDLPPGVVEMNDYLPPPPDDVQSIEEIQRIVREAQVALGANTAYMTDDYIDDTIDENSIEPPYQ